MQPTRSARLTGDRISISGTDHPGVFTLPALRCKGHYWVCHPTPAAAADLAAAGFELDDDLKLLRLHLSGYGAFGQAPVPQHCRFEQWHHQADGYNFVWPRAASYLGYGMGTGKSKIVVDVLQNQEAENGPKLTLVLCPLSVLGVWRRELDKHCTRGYRLLALDQSTGARKAEALDRFVRTADSGQEQVVVVNYDCIWRDPLARCILQQPWTNIIADEAHRIKSPSGRAARYCAKLNPVAKKRIALSGTPMSHSKLDIWAQYQFLDPGVYGTSYSRFKSHYAVPGYFPSQVAAWKNTEEFEERLGLLMLRVGNEVLDLPPLVQQTVSLPLCASARKLYNQLADELAGEVGDSTVVVQTALVKILRLQQITSGFIEDTEGRVHEVDGSKRDALVELLEGIPSDEPVVVFCRFKHDLRVIADAARALKRSYGELSGSRHDLTDHATMPEGISVYGVQIKSGGVGVDLTRAPHAVIFSNTWTLAEYEQAIARVHRPGQTKTTRIWTLECAGTIDSDIANGLRSKRDAIEEVLNGIRNRGKSCQTQDT
jgi:SNF2 family DNA or RNA helicase